MNRSLLGPFLATPHARHPARPAVGRRRPVCVFLACLGLAAGAIPHDAQAEAGKRGGGLGGWGVYDSDDQAHRGCEGGGIETFDPLIGPGGGAAGTGHATAGGAGGQAALATAAAFVWVNGLDTFEGQRGLSYGSPLPEDTVSAGGGGAGIVGSQDVTVIVNAGGRVIGGNGGNATLATIDPTSFTIVRGGGGGGGGAGIAAPAGSLQLRGSIIGGNGGDSTYNGGGGGDAVVLTSGTIEVGVGGTLVGGSGGRLTSNATNVLGSGDGGNGISIGSGTVINAGTVTAGAAGSVSLAAPRGKNGAALRAGNNTNVFNQGVFTSGTDAVVFEGNDNTLTLWQGSITIGNVRFEGARNTLAIGSNVGIPTSVATVTGSVDFGTRGIYAVRVTPTQADQLNVTGSATLTGATVQVTAVPGGYAANTAYPILHAGGTFNGTRFAGATSNLAYLTPLLSYSDNDQDASLILTRRQVPPVTPGTDPDPPTSPSARPIRFADLVSGRNPVAAANAVDGLPVSHEVYRHALNLPNGAPQSFFSALSGETHASVASALQGLGGQARSVPLAQLRANLGAGLRPGAPAAAAGISDAAPAASTLPASNAQPAWAQVVGNWQRLGATGDTAAVRQHTGGVFAGADGAVGGGWRLGGALGYTDSELRTDGVDAKTDISSYSAIVYGGKAFEAGPGKLNLLLGAAYTWHDIRTKRRIAVGGLDQTLRADYGASTTQVFTELGWALKAGDAFTVEPYAGLAWAGQRSRGFGESGGSAALSGRSQTNNTTTTTLGLRGRQALALGTFQGTLTGGAGWHHAFGDMTPTSRMAFDAGDSFTVAGAPIARNAALLEAGLDAAIGRNATVGLSYAGQFGAGNQDHGATLSWRWAF